MASTMPQKPHLMFVCIHGCYTLCISTYGLLWGLRRQWKETRKSFLISFLYLYEKVKAIKEAQTKVSCMVLDVSLQKQVCTCFAFIFTPHRELTYTLFLLSFSFFLFSYNCLHFLPIPPPHPSQSHLPPPTSTLPLDFVLVYCYRSYYKGHTVTIFELSLTLKNMEIAWENLGF